VIPTTLERRRLVRITEDQEPRVVHGFDQAGDERVEKARTVIGLVSAAPQPAAQFAPTYIQAAPVYAQPSPVYVYPGPSYEYYDGWPCYWGYPSVSVGFGFGRGYFRIKVTSLEATVSASPRKSPATTTNPITTPVACITCRRSGHCTR